MAKNKFYGVKVGRQIGVFNSWEECKRQIDGFSGAVYKGFVKESDAYDYVYGESEKNNKDEEILVGVVAYVDGSFDESTNRYSYGVSITNGDSEIHLSGTGNNLGMAAMRNVAGEIMGSIEAMKYAKNNDIKEITIVHDYQGISSWALGEWKANKPETQAYQRFCDKMSEYVKFSFCKVKGHSNNFQNDVVDALAKNALGITTGIKKNVQEHINKIAHGE